MPKKLFKPGESGNKKGRPKGQRSYATIYREALEKIALARNKTPDEIEVMMLEGGITKSLKGDFKFYQDTHDRIHGKPIQTSKIQGDAENPIETHYTITFVQ